MISKEVVVVAGTTTKTIYSNAPVFLGADLNFDPLLQIAVDTVAIHPPLETPFVGAAHPSAAPANGRHY